MVKGAEPETQPMTHVRKSLCRSVRFARPAPGVQFLFAIHGFRFGSVTLERGAERLKSVKDDSAVSREVT